MFPYDSLTSQRMHAVSGARVPIVGIGRRPQMSWRVCDRPDNSTKVEFRKALKLTIETCAPKRPSLAQNLIGYAAFKDAPFLPVEVISLEKSSSNVSSNPIPTTQYENPPLSFKLRDIQLAMQQQSKYIALLPQSAGGLRKAGSKEWSSTALNARAYTTCLQ